MRTATIRRLLGTRWHYTTGVANKPRKTYIDQWFESIVKPSSFYEEHANASPIRRYFYNVDLQGRLFLEETLPKNIATSLKDSKFLDFFFRRVRNTKPDEVFLLQSCGIDATEYPFVSPCGKELNFIRPAATPIVFHSLSADQLHLVYGGSLTIPFDPMRLAISNKTGRLFHQFTVKCDPNTIVEALDFGLIRSSLAVTL